MDIDRMREYVKLCETLNFTKAAKDLFISQSTLSKHISQTEDEVGAPLILRSTHDAELTKEGELVRERFERMLDDYDALLGEVAELRDGVTGSLRVGFIYYGGMSYMREGLDRFYANYPNVRIEFVSQQPHDTIAGLRNGTLDVGLIPECASLEDEGFSFVPVHECKLYAFVSSEGRYAGRQSVAPADLSGAKIVMLDADEDYNDAICAALLSAGVESFEECRCPQIDLYAMTVMRDDAVFISSGHVPVTPGDPVVALPIVDTDITLPVGFHYRHDDMTGALRVFIGSFSSGT